MPFPVFWGNFGSALLKDRNLKVIGKFIMAGSTPPILVDSVCWHLHTHSAAHCGRSRNLPCILLPLTTDNRTLAIVQNRLNVKSQFVIVRDS